MIFTESLLLLSTNLTMAVYRVKKACNRIMIFTFLFIPRFRYVSTKDEHLGLEIVATKLEDAGEYTFLACNKYGTNGTIQSATFKCQLIVESKL